MQRDRNYLKQEFRDGEIPTGADFADLIDSFLNKVDDGLSVSADPNRNLVLANGLSLGDTDAGQAGTLRFRGGVVEFHNGAAFQALATSGGGGFAPVGGGPSIAFNTANGNVGINVNNPTHKLEVELGANASTADRVKFGNLVVARSTGSGVNAMMSHFGLAGDPNAFSIRISPEGNLMFNTASTRTIGLSVAGGAAFLSLEPARATANYVVKANRPFVFFSLAGEPPLNDTLAGMVYFNTATLKLRVCTVVPPNGPATWVDLH